MPSGEPSGVATPVAFDSCSRTRAEVLYRRALGVSLALSAILYLPFTWRWPLVGDASVMHYLAFLIERGWAPYRQIGDQQFPGAYLTEIAGMHLFGMGSLGWRLFDFTLMGIAAAALFAILSSHPAVSSGPAQAPISNPHASSRRRWLPGLLAASLFILIHGRDGFAQGGQRDLTISVLLLAATAFLVRAVERNRLWSSALFGFLSGIACSIKPVVLPLQFAQLVFACWVLRRRKNLWLRHAIAAAVCWLIAPAISLAFLLHEHATAAFLAGFHGMVPYYASLGHRPLSYVVQHSLSPVLPLVILWIVLLALGTAASRTKPVASSRTTPKRSLIDDWRRTLLAGSALFALTDCILQARALPYYRYPLLAFLLPLIATDLCRAVDQPSESGSHSSAARVRRLRSALAWIGLSFAAFFLAPQSAVLIHRYRWWDTPYLISLEHSLTQLGGPALSRHIQCIDSIDGCTTVLYRMRLEPVSGMLGDYVLFGPDTVPVVRDARLQFERDAASNPPRVIVVSSGLFLGNAQGFSKLERWPELERLLETRYRLAVQWSPTHTVRWWSREELPASYRIYLLRDWPGATQVLSKP